MSSCEAVSSQSQCDSNQECCPVEKSLEDLNCPEETSAKMGNKAFFEAMRQVQVESLKEKIKSAWGEKID